MLPSDHLTAWGVATVSVRDETQFYFFQFFPYTRPASRARSTAVRTSSASRPRSSGATWCTTWPRDDRLTPPGLAEDWAALIPDVTVKTFPAAEHLVLDESPAAAAAVADFLG